MSSSIRPAVRRRVCGSSPGSPLSGQVPCTLAELPSTKSPTSATLAASAGLASPSTMPTTAARPATIVEARRRRRWRCAVIMFLPKLPGAARGHTSLNGNGPGFAMAPRGRSDQIRPRFTACPSNGFPHVAVGKANTWPRRDTTSRRSRVDAGIPGLDATKDPSPGPSSSCVPCAGRTGSETACLRGGRGLATGRTGILVVERDDRADDRAGLQVLDGLVHVLDVDLLRDHAVEVEAPVLPQVEHAVEVTAHVGRAVVRAHESLLVEEQLEGVERDGLVQAADADDARRAPAPGDVVGRPHRLRQADRLERVVEAVAGGGRRLGALEVVGLDRMRGPE